MSDIGIEFGMDWAAAPRGQVGFAASGWTVYINGGVAMGGIEGGASDEVAASDAGLMDVRSSGVQVGFTIGAGVEWRFAQTGSLGLAYRHLPVNDIAATGVAEAPTIAFCVSPTIWASPWSGSGPSGGSD